MKQIYIAFAVVLIFHVSAIAQTTEEKSKIIQVCLDLPDIQNLFPKDANGNFIAIHIMQYPIALPTDLPVTKFGKSLVFMNRHDIYDNQVKTYFLFQTLDIAASKALTQFTIYYDQTSAEKKAMLITLDLDKINGDWIITNKDIKKY